jgi:prepilin-type N-terminal cleavage/methylation domain-containing protein
MSKWSERGFTLLEMAVVLVIIGLIVGGIMVGIDLIKSAAVRAQITQIEKFNQAVHTFQGKYGALPGDMDPTTAQQFGFTVGAGCNGTSGGRYGNGFINSWSWQLYLGGENLLFWQDLSNLPGGVSLIEGQFPNSGAAAITCNAGVGALSINPGTTYIGDYLPAAKIGKLQFVDVYVYNGANWYNVQGIGSVNAGSAISGTTYMPVIQAYKIDSKIDDGLPTTGIVQAMYNNGGTGSANQNTPTLAPNAATDGATCYNTTGPAYSIGYQGGSNTYCALAFQFQ